MYVLTNETMTSQKTGVCIYLWDKNSAPGHCANVRVPLISSYILEIET